jgi:hypothetical protein
VAIMATVTRRVTAKSAIDTRGSLRSGQRQTSA